VRFQPQLLRLDAGDVADRRDLALVRSDHRGDIARHHATISDRDDFVRSERARARRDAGPVRGSRPGGYHRADTKSFPEPQRGEGIMISETPAPLLRIVSLTKRFGGFTALDNVNVEIPQGERFGLIGPNGSGKTTLINCISGAFRTEP